MADSSESAREPCEGRGEACLGCADCNGRGLSARLEVALAERDAHERRVRELEARIELASEVASNCSGDYMRAILSGEIDRDEHESRTL